MLLAHIYKSRNLIGLFELKMEKDYIISTKVEI